MVLPKITLITDFYVLKIACRKDGSTAGGDIFLHFIDKIITLTKMVHMVPLRKVKNHVVRNSHWATALNMERTLFL